jgi:hypothetical protein
MPHEGGAFRPALEWGGQGLLNRQDAETPRRIGFLGVSSLGVSLPVKEATKILAEFND